MSYEYNKTKISTSWIEKLRKTPQKPKNENPTYLVASENAVPKSILNAHRTNKVTHLTEQKQRHKQNIDKILKDAFQIPIITGDNRILGKVPTCSIIL